MHYLWKIAAAAATLALTGCAGTDLYVVNEHGEPLSGLGVLSMRPEDKWVLRTDANGHVEVPRGTTQVFITENVALSSFGHRPTEPLTAASVTLHHNPETVVWKPSVRQEPAPRGDGVGIITLTDARLLQGEVPRRPSPENPKGGT